MTISQKAIRHNSGMGMTWSAIALTGMIMPC